VDTPETTVILKGLRPDAGYEIVIKAGNENGTSQLTSPVQFFTTTNNYYVETTEGSLTSPWPSVVGSLLAVVLTGAAVAVGALYYKKRRDRDQFRAKTFENPVEFSTERGVDLDAKDLEAKDMEMEEKSADSGDKEGIL